MMNFFFTLTICALLSTPLLTRAQTELATDSQKTDSQKQGQISNDDRPEADDNFEETTAEEVSLAAEDTTLFDPKDNRSPMFFQVDKNYIQVLAQRFEYTQIDQQTLRIGDIIIDSGRFGFQISQNKKGIYAVKFVWPAGLLTDGQIVIRDNSGKALYSTEISKKSLKLIAGKKTDAEIRSERAEMIVRGLDKKVIDQMRALPYMQLCLFQSTEATRIYLCSQDVYLTKEKNKFRVIPRSTNKRQAFVQVNGKEVGPQGIIFLNDPDESLSFESLSETGASLEISTRMKKIDFKDVIVGKSEDEILMIASGAEPANKDISKRLPNGDWQITLNAKRPVLFMKGEGGVPLRQEFFVKGSLPRSDLRPFLDSNTPTKTYQSSITLNGQGPEAWSVQPAQPDSKVQVNSKDQKKFRWILEKIPPGILTRHYLSIAKGNEKFMASYDLFKANPYVLSGGALFSSPANQVSGSLSGQWWFEDFMGQRSDLTSYRWGMELSYRTLIVKKTEDAKASEINLALHYRLTPGFHLIDPSHSIKLLASNKTLASESLTLMGVGFNYQNLMNSGWGLLDKNFKWWNTGLDLYMGGKSKNIEIESSHRIYLEALSEMSHGLYLAGSLGIENTTIKNADNEPQMQLGAQVMWQF